MKVLQQSKRQMQHRQGWCQPSTCLDGPAWSWMCHLPRSTGYLTIWAPAVWELSAESTDSSLWCGSSVGFELNEPSLCSWRAGQAILSGLCLTPTLKELDQYFRLSALRLLCFSEQAVVHVWPPRPNWRATEFHKAPEWEKSEKNPSFRRGCSQARKRD